MVALLELLWRARPRWAPQIFARLSEAHGVADASDVSVAIPRLAEALHEHHASSLVFLSL